MKNNEKKRDRTRKIIDRPLEEIIPPKVDNKNIAKRISTDNRNLDFYYRRPLNSSQIINIPFTLLNNTLGEIAERFDICICEECLSSITYKALENFEDYMCNSDENHTFILVKDKLDEDFVNQLLKMQSPEMKKILVKICLDAKKNPPHLNAINSFEEDYFFDE